MSDQVHDIFFQVSACTGDDMNFVLADHLREAETQFGRAHGSRKGHHHFFTFRKVLFISFGCIYQSGCIEVQVVLFNK
jgi:hypothetical protein